MKIWVLFFSFLLLCLTNGFTQSYDSCDSECEMPSSCRTLIECRVTSMRCLDSCRQRKAWETLTQAVEKFSFSLAKKISELSEKFGSLQEYLLDQDIKQTKQISELSKKIDLLQKYVKPPDIEEKENQLQER